MLQCANAKDWQSHRKKRISGIMRYLPLLIIYVMLAPPAYAASEQNTSAVATFTHWRLFVRGVGQDKNCTIIAEPRTIHPRNVRRGDIYLSVSHRPAQQVFNEVSVNVGYPFSVISNPFATINGDNKQSREFSFFSGAQARNGADESAWLRDLQTTPQLIQAMRAGSAFVFKGTSARGTLTSDNYSLIGFTAALKAMDRHCPRS